MNKKLIKLSSLIFTFSLTSCSFSYPKAVTLDSAKKILDESYNTFVATDLTKYSRFGVGLSYSEWEKNKERHPLKEKIFFLLYEVKADGYLIDYYLSSKEKEEENTYCTLKKEKEGVFVKDNLISDSSFKEYNESEYPFFKPYLDFPSDYFSVKNKQTYILSSKYLKDIGATNSFTAFQALSLNNKNLDINFKGSGFELSSLFGLPTITNESYTSFRAKFDGGFVKEATSTISYIDKANKQIDIFGKVDLDFELS